METLHTAIENKDRKAIDEFITQITDATDVEKTRDNFRKADALYKAQYGKNLLASASESDNKYAVQLFYPFSNGIKESESIALDDISFDTEPPKKGRKLLKERLLSMTRNPNETIHLKATPYPGGGSYPLEQFLGVHMSRDLTKPLWKVMKADDTTQILNRRLKYNKDDKKLHSFTKPSEVASTIGKKSKKHDDVQAFILSQNGNLYIDTHTGVLSQGATNLNHGTLSGGMPVIIAGLIKIDDGKIEMLSNNSGHYQGDELNMYRAITKMQKEMPEVFATGCMIDIYGLQPKRLTDFISKINGNNKSGKPYHQAIHDKKLKERERYNELVSLAPLNKAIINGHLEKAKEYISNFDDIKAADEAYFDIYAATLLIHAIQLNRTDIAEFLLRQNINLNLANSYGDTALHWAAANGHNEIARILIEKNASILAKNNNSHTPLSLAYINGHKEIVKLISEKLSSIDLFGKYGTTALHMAIQEGYSRRVFKKGIQKSYHFY